MTPDSFPTSTGSSTQIQDRKLCVVLRLNICGVCVVQKVLIGVWLCMAGPEIVSSPILSSIINIILHIVNPCFSSGIFQHLSKSAIIYPLNTKQGLDSENVKEL